MKEKTIADPTLLAIDGGEPVRGESLPYGRQTIEPEDIQAAMSVSQRSRAPPHSPDRQLFHSQART